jgi:hypothetical protein
MWTELLSCLLSFGFWSFVIFTDETEDGQAKAWQAHEEVEYDREIVGSVCDQREQKVETDAEHIYHLQKNKIGLLQHIQTIWNVKKRKNAKKSMPINNLIEGSCDYFFWHWVSELAAQLEEKRRAGVQAWKADHVKNGD